LITASSKATGFHKRLLMRSLVVLVAKVLFSSSGFTGLAL
jgi:hypothetical protein